MTDNLAISHPPTIINEYLKAKIGGYFAGDDAYNLVFFPTGPTNIDDLTENFPNAVDNVFAVYDRMFRLRRQAFPHVKCEQVLYYFYKKANAMKELIETIQLVQDLLDRGDESAHEVNEWVRKLAHDQGNTQVQRPNIVDTNIIENFDVVTFANEDFLVPTFTEFKIFQLEEARDIIDFGTARTWAGNKLIINYDWIQQASQQDRDKFPADRVTS